MSLQGGPLRRRTISPLCPLPLHPLAVSGTLHPGQCHLGGAVMSPVGRAENIPANLPGGDR